MARLWAMYVEDEIGDATDRFQREISSAGFEVARAYSAEEARACLSEVSRDGRLVDLIVLDRKLPPGQGSPATETVGDRLFEELEAQYPDSPIVVLTGFSDEDFALLVLQRENTLELGVPNSVQRVVHIKKGKALQFRETLQKVGGALQRTEGIALEGAPAARPARRVLKRVGQLFDGAVVHVKPATGGASDASVWLCDVESLDGRWLTSVVVKIGARDEPRPSGGFMASVPAANAAQPMHFVSGACGGATGHVAPLAGRGTSSLAEVLGADETEAVEAVGKVVALLDQVHLAVMSLPLSQFVEPLVEWSRAREIANSFDIPLPPESLPVPTHHGCLHGDLHPGNVLMNGGQPVFIDFDRQRSGSLLIDSMSLALGAVFNKEGPLRNAVPDAELVESCLLGSGDESIWFAACFATWSQRGFGERERWAGLLAYCLRQLKYPDVLTDDDRRTLALNLARRSSEALEDS